MSELEDFFDNCDLSSVKHADMAEEFNAPWQFAIVEVTGGYNIHFQRKVEGKLESYLVGERRGDWMIYNGLKLNDPNSPYAKEEVPEETLRIIPAWNEAIKRALWYQREPDSVLRDMYTDLVKAAVCDAFAMVKGVARKCLQ